MASVPSVRLEGDTAILHGDVQIRVVAQGRTHRLSTVCTLVYWHIDGRWQLVAYQSTLSPEPAGGAGGGDAALAPATPE